MPKNLKQFTHEKLYHHTFPFDFFHLLPSPGQGRLADRGAASFNTSNRDYGSGEIKNFNARFSPFVSTFIQDEWELGIKIPLAYSESTSTFGTSTDMYLGVGALVRKYFPINDRFFIFSGFEVDFLRSESTYTNIQSTSLNNLSAELNAGITYKFCPRFLAYGKVSALSFGGNENGYSGGFFVDGFGSVLNLGLVFIFRRSPAMRTTAGEGSD